jgi:hypothetical protein
MVFIIYDIIIFITMGRIPLAFHDIKLPPRIPDNLCEIIENLQDGDRVYLNIHDDLRIRNELAESSNLPPPIPRLMRASSNYGCREFQIEPAEYVVISRDVRVSESESTRGLRGIIIVPVSFSDEYKFNQIDPYTISVNQDLHYVTFVLTTDGHFRDSERWDPKNVWVTDLNMMSSKYDVNMMDPVTFMDVGCDEN